MFQPKKDQAIDKASFLWPIDWLIDLIDRRLLRWSKFSSPVIDYLRCIFPRFSFSVARESISCSSTSLRPPVMIGWRIPPDWSHRAIYKRRQTRKDTWWITWAKMKQKCQANGRFFDRLFPLFCLHPPQFVYQAALRDTRGTAYCPAQTSSAAWRERASPSTRADTPASLSVMTRRWLGSLPYHQWPNQSEEKPAITFQLRSNQPTNQPTNQSNKQCSSWLSIDHSINQSTELHYWNAYQKIIEQNRHEH